MITAVMLGGSWKMAVRSQKGCTLFGSEVQEISGSFHMRGIKRGMIVMHAALGHVAIQASKMRVGTVQAREGLREGNIQ